MKLFIVILVILSTSFSGFTQDKKSGKKIRVVGDDISTPGYVLKDVVIQTDNSDYIKKYRNARYFVRRVYAYSQLASQMLNEYQDSLLTMNSEREKRKYLKNCNKELKEEFGEEIKEMSVQRGEYLNKLIYRETGLSTYDIIKDYRGGMKAVFWQSLCKLNGQNLKMTYDPNGEDAIIERIIGEIEAGEIKTFSRSAVSQKGKEVESRNDKKRKKKNKKSDLASR